MEFISLQGRLIRDELVCNQSHGLPGPSSVERLLRGIPQGRGQHINLQPESRFSVLVPE